MKSYRFLATLDVLPSCEDTALLRRSAKLFIGLLRTALIRHNLKANVVVGGSFAKGTLIKNDNYEVDIFLRTSEGINSFTEKLASALSKLCSQKDYSFERLHGSRDYFRIRLEKIVFEIVPVLAIRNLAAAKNITDLSYAHVGYICRKLLRNKKLIREIALAKQFCKAQRVYGAESYVHGFSGYSLECLIIHYKSFLNMARALICVKNRLILDPEHHYKHLSDIPIMVNASKLQSPVVLIDPTWKERNVLAALSQETFVRFQKALRNFLIHPSPAFFVACAISKDELMAAAKNKKAEFVHLLLATERQAGDIAGTKLRKFFEFINAAVQKKFFIVQKEFAYNGWHEADAYYIIIQKKPKLLRGPLSSMGDHARAFKKAHNKVIMKKGRLYAIPKEENSASAFLKRFLRDYDKIMKEMDISEAKIMSNKESQSQQAAGYSLSVRNLVPERRRESKIQDSRGVKLEKRSKLRGMTPSLSN